MLYLVWMWRRLGTPVFDFFLQFDPLGRHLLTRDERLAARLVAACFAAGAAQAAFAVVDPTFLALAAASVSALPWFLYLNALEPPGPRRRVRTFAVSPALVLIDAGVTVAAIGEVGLLPDEARAIGGIAATAGLCYFFLAALVLSRFAPPRAP